MVKYKGYKILAITSDSVYYHISTVKRREYAYGIRQQHTNLHTSNGYD